MRSLSVLATGVLIASTAAIPYDEYILAPRSRTVHPTTVHSSNGSVTTPESLTKTQGRTIFDGEAATVYDFGINIAGIVSLNISSVSDSSQYIGVTFSESSLWISNASSDATADLGKDETLWFHVTAPGQYAAPRDKERGGFRYLTLVHNSTGTVEVTGLDIHYTAMPHWGDDELGNYSGYFHSNDELLNRIWYAGAYTNQLCTIDPTHGNALTHIADAYYNISLPLDAINSTWYYNATIANGTSALVDGAKRDRLVWPGDMIIAVPSVIVSTYDVITIENSLNSLFDNQAPDGHLPYGGRPFPDVTVSFTYHLHTLIGVAFHYLYTGDITYLQSLWPQWKHGLSWSLSSIDASGLMNVSSSYDWLRFGMGGHNIEANAILYYTINQGIKLAAALNDTSSTSEWTSFAEGIKASANSFLWNEQAGMYIDNETTTLMPQDGNTWSVISNLTVNSTQAQRISSALVDRWTPFGAPAVEAANAISPFISSFELQAHFLAENTTASLELMRRQWGFMLDDPRMTNSTFIEGYSANGEIHYPPYPNDARVSHAHAWASGPTSSLTFYVAGLQLLSAGGKTWRIAPSLGDLKTAEAGFRTDVGFFVTKTQVSDDGTWETEFETPEGTTGEVKLPELGCIFKAALNEQSGRHEEILVEAHTGSVTIGDLPGGEWKVRYGCAPL